MRSKFTFLLSFLLLLLALPSYLRAEPATTNLAGVVVDLGGGQVQTYCIAFAEEQISGFVALQRTGLPIEVDVSGMGSTERGGALQGHHAGSVSRFVAFLLDQMAMGASFAWGQWMLTLAIEVVLGSSWQPTDHRVAVAVMYLSWAFVYYALPLAVAGRTIGMAVLGLQVVRSDGSAIDGRHAAVRTLALPVSFALFGIGLLLGLVRRDRRQLHDLVADTSVVYAWDAEIARLRAHRGGLIPPGV
jgi:uncharacterized RDD family membrane protein YckC